MVQILPTHFIDGQGDENTLADEKNLGLTFSQLFKGHRLSLQAHNSTIAKQ